MVPLAILAGLGGTYAPGCAHPGFAVLVTTSAQAESGYSTEILTIDGKPPTERNRRLSPGRHTVEAEGHCADHRVAVGVLGAIVAANRFNPPMAGRSETLVACFIVRGGRDYEVRTYAEGGVWKIEVVDQTTTFDVKSPCKETDEAPMVLTGGPQPQRKSDP